MKRAGLMMSLSAQLLLDRDPHGNVQVAKIETEVLLAHAVEAELAELATQGRPGNVGILSEDAKRFRSLRCVVAEIYRTVSQIYVIRLFMDTHIIPNDAAGRGASIRM